MKKNLQKESKKIIKTAVNLLKLGKLVSVQTETVYGVACDPSNINSIKKVYELKKRPLYNPLIIHVCSMKMAEELALFNSDARSLTKTFWPGPLTLILPKKKNDKIHDFAISGLNTIAIRFPKSHIFLQILKKFKKPIAAPSANESGYISSTNAKHVQDSFGNRIELIIDSGQSFFGLESTVIDMTKKPYKIARQGVIDEKLVLEKTKIKVVLDSSAKNQKIISPGQMLKHYSPRTPLKINVLDPQKNDGFLIFGKSNGCSSHKPTLNLSKKGDLYEAAYNLFDYLRKLDKMDIKRIVVSPIPNHGIGKTINERLLRAMTKK